ncbi:MAG TPA: acetyl-CoA C-acyltransferase family protein [Lautropia sp.]|nr:acetyl-CoA C-acyltransferase family protein [Lautropia sp.]
MSKREVVIVSAVRTGVGDFGGGLKDISPCDLGTLVIREAIGRCEVDPASVGHVYVGHVIDTEPRDLYLSRVAALGAGLPQEVAAANVNRLCGSGLQAIVSAAQAILLGDTDVAIGGGAESMSRAPYHLPSNRWGARMGDAKVIDMLVGALSDPFDAVHMGITAENVAARYEISREAQDELAVQSHQRAGRAWKEGRFVSQVVPVETKVKRKPFLFAADEHIRDGVTLEALKSLRAAFREDGSVTAGNASGINDGASAVVLMEAAEAARRGVKPLARLVSYGHAGVEPLYMGIGPVPATRLALKKAGLKVSDLDVIEANEAFAAQACAVARELDFDPEKVNPNGSGISIGHPVGATGAIITTKAIHELQRTGGRYALVTMCIGGGQGIAAVFERV